MDEIYFKRISTTIILITLSVISFFLLKPILLAIISGILLAFLFSPVFNWMNKKIKRRNISALIITFSILIVIFFFVWFFTPIIIDQALKIYFASQDIDFTTPLAMISPTLFGSEDFSREIASILFSFTNKTLNSLVTSLSGIIFNFPRLFLQLSLAFFTFYFVLRDKDKLLLYIKSLMPFSKEVENKLFEQSEGITKSVLYGQLVIGVIQGLVVGLGFFIFGVPNALLLTLFACFAGIFPVIGTSIIWIPTLIYLLLGGNIFAGVGVAIFGFISSIVDNILKPMIVSKRTNIPTPIILIGMVGGFFLFGILGFILGPLILAYLLIILDIYRNKRVPGLLVQETPKKLKIGI